MAVDDGSSSGGTPGGGGSSFSIGDVLDKYRMAVKKAELPMCDGVDPMGWITRAETYFEVQGTSVGVCQNQAYRPKYGWPHNSLVQFVEGDQGQSYLVEVEESSD